MKERIRTCRLPDIYHRPGIQGRKTGILFDESKLKKSNGFDTVESFWKACYLPKDTRWRPSFISELEDERLVQSENLARFEKLSLKDKSASEPNLPSSKPHPPQVEPASDESSLESLYQELADNNSQINLSTPALFKHSSLFETPIQITTLSVSPMDSQDTPYVPIMVSKLKKKEKMDVTQEGANEKKQEREKDAPRNGGGKTKVSPKKGKKEQSEVERKNSKTSPKKGKNAQKETEKQKKK